jgi:glycosyltransferase involved in cell wall biosynthesis
MISEGREHQGTQARLVLHVLPSAVARGAQVYARALVDLLDTPEDRHELIVLYSGSAGIEVDASLGRPGGRAPAVGFDPRTAFRLHQFVRAHSPDVVVAHGGDSLKYVVSAFSGVPVVYHAIGTVAASVNGTLRRSLWRGLIRRADLVATVSQDVADECSRLLRVPREKLRLVPNGRDAARFRPLSDADRADEAPLVIFVGRLTRGKRPDEFVRLIRSLRERGISCRGLLVGDGPLRGELEAPSAEAGVEIVGECTDVDLLMRRADLLAFLSLPEGEGMPGVLIEAGLSGVPVIATAVPGASSVVEDGVTGAIVDLWDVASWVDRAAALLSDRDLRHSMGVAARRRCETMFSMEVSADRWREVLDRYENGNGR